MGRHKGISLCQALVICAQFEPLKKTAKQLLGDIVLREVSTHRIAAVLGVTPRHARRVLALYGWNALKEPT